MKEILERRSIRKYENKALSLDLLKKIIGAALKAPSAKIDNRGNSLFWFLRKKINLCK